ncbi:Cilia- and flagella-associated protein 61 [Bagarius yarrelli]|uniref:Cilia-and flagella-associated protein 61 n=1 Tax=Bagarius yarrelli TaxID=175774 RepID=A0A556UYF2_BAGYA|nr:Cilia- and flagella-associated protein 61 [Bagarius yarrelli]
MTTITSSTGENTSVTVRRTESCDAHKITELMSPATETVFGKVNVIHLLEKANLGVTISTEKNEVLAHASFVDHPIGDLVDQASWEKFLQTHFKDTQFTPLNTIFLHLFVAQPGFSSPSAKEIIRVEDLIDLTYLEQMRTLGDCWPVPDVLAEKIDTMDEMNQVAVFENKGHAVGFIIVSGQFNLLSLKTEYNLGPFDGLKKKKAEKKSEDLDQLQQSESTDDISDPLKPNAQSEVKETGSIRAPFIDSGGNDVTFGAEDNAFLIQIHLDKRFETRMLEVRVAVSEDKPAIQKLVPHHQTLLEDLDLFFQPDLDIQTFVAQVEGQVIGVLVIKDEQDIEYIRANYDTENFVYFSQHQREEHGRLCQFALNPIFQHYAKHFLKEALRLAHKSCLYYRVYPSCHKDKSVVAHSVTAVLSCMVPVHPRRQIIYPLKDLGINAPSSLITSEQVPYALNHINRKLTMESKININAKIVVVGASDTGLAFLEALTFCPHLQFNSLTLISPHGLPEYLSTDNISFLSTRHCYSKSDYAQLSLHSWVNVVEGKMTKIDRKMTRVQVNGTHRIPYDHLILCTGQQYQMFCPTGVDISKWSSTSSVPEQRIFRYTGHIPSNLFTLNDQQDCMRAYQWLIDNFLQQEGDALVYGDTIDVYTCVETLLQLGVTGSRIHVVHQTAPGSTSSFQNLTVFQAVRTALEKQNVHIYHNCLLAQMNDGQHPEPLTSVSFTKDGPPLRLECAVFFNFSRKGVDYKAFNAINNAHLLFDGRLVIDSNYHTNDRKIHAAGPSTKLSRRHYADQWCHLFFNSKEVGQELASMLLHLLDPTLEPPAKSGRSIKTGSVETGNYFQLRFSQDNLVESITCLSFNPLPVSNYICLYGKHQQLLNRLYGRFDEDLIHDFYSYFRESWCLAIFHDRFADFQQEVQQIMTAKLDSDSTSITELSERITDGSLELSADPHEQKEALNKVKESVLQYLQFNQYHLPMYYQPGMIQL